MRTIAVVGAGIYGCWIAYVLSKKGYHINLFEKNHEIISESSKLNQYRIHRGYHYLKSLNTAYRCQANYEKFIQFFSSAVHSNFKSFYAISKYHSKINGTNFERVCNLLNMPFEKKKLSNYEIYNTKFIENVYEVDEKIYNVDELRKIFFELLKNKNINIFFNSKVKNLNINENYLNTSDDEIFKFDYLFNCTYSDIEQFNNTSNEDLELSYVLSEIGIIKVPQALKNIGITVIDGPFFSLLPINNHNHTISHVTYTHLEKNKKNNFFNKKEYLNKNISYVNLKKMILDASRYIPEIKKSLIIKSFYQIKAIQKKNNMNDSRPIIIKKKDKCFNIVGSKIDNIFDINEYLKKHF